MRIHWFGLILLLAATSVWADCDHPGSMDESTRCLGIELRVQDQRINDSYQALMNKFGAADKAALREAQRAWLKKRDAACRLNTRETSRERWFADLLRDTRTTTCVLRFTSARSQQIEALLDGSVAAAGGDTLDQNNRYEVLSASGKTRGKWYFEVDMNVTEVAQAGEMAFSVGYTSSVLNPTWLISVRKRDAGRGTVSYGFAIDLDNGKFYGSENGQWTYGAPDSSAGMDVKLGQNYRAMVNSSVVIDPFLKSGAVSINFGDKPFHHPPPAGYRPFLDGNPGNR